MTDSQHAGSSDNPGGRPARSEVPEMTMRQRLTRNMVVVLLAAGSVGFALLSVLAALGLVR